MPLEDKWNEYMARSIEIKNKMQEINEELSEMKDPRSKVTVLGIAIDKIERKRELAEQKKKRAQVLAKINAFYELLRSYKERKNNREREIEMVLARSRERRAPELAKINAFGKLLQADREAREKAEREKADRDKVDRDK